MSKLVSEKEYSTFKRILARITYYPKVGNNFYLGHCKKHGYFIDREHTNGEIRCPSCDKKWLLHRKMILP